MIYPEDFKKEAKRLYPTWTDLHERIQSGSVSIGKMLLYGGNSTEEICKKIMAANSLEEAKELAEIELAKKELLRKWHNL